MRASFLIELLLGENSVNATSEIRTKYMEDNKEDILGAYTCYSLLTVIMCNLGSGHNNEVVGHEDRYA